MSALKTTLTLEVPHGMDEQLEKLAQATARTKAWIALEALRSFLELYDWQVKAIREGIADADAGRLVDHDKVSIWLESWGTENELPPPSCD
ncbi:MAG TPA: CopG family ribbon-helix-helix protein [Thermoanaerobaculia bacterium]|jgi:predicted transcriptional regulator